jgi:hypothetical protein
LVSISESKFDARRSYLGFLYFKIYLYEIARGLVKIIEKDVHMLYGSVEAIPDFVKFNLKRIKPNACEGYTLNSKE